MIIQEFNIRINPSKSPLTKGSPIESLSRGNKRGVINRKFSYDSLDKLRKFYEFKK